MVLHHRNKRSVRVKNWKRKSVRNNCNKELVKGAPDKTGGGTAGMTGLMAGGLFPNLPGGNATGTAVSNKMSYLKPVSPRAFDGRRKLFTRNNWI